MTKLYIIRGISGSGKTTFANKLKEAEETSSAVHYETDMFFMEDGQYKFNPTKLSEAHNWCFKQVTNSLLMEHNVIVSNTFTQYWELKPYIDFCVKNGIEYVIYRMTKEYPNTHNVPEASINRMRSRFEDVEGEIKVE